MNGIPSPRERGGRTTNMMKAAVAYQKEKSEMVLIIAADRSQARQLCRVWIGLDDRPRLMHSQNAIYQDGKIIARIKSFEELPPPFAFSTRPEVFVDHYVYEKASKTGRSLL